MVQPENYGKASSHYGLLWWNNADGTLDEVPRDTFWSWGLYDSLIVVIPSLDIVVARAGKSWQREKGADHYDVLRPFVTPICNAAAIAQAAKAGDTILIVPGAYEQDLPKQLASLRAANVAISVVGGDH